MTLARLASMTKFMVLLLASVGVLWLVGGAWRLMLLAHAQVAGSDVLPPPDSARPSVADALAAFRELMARESAGIFPTPHTRAPDAPVLADNVAADEPRVIFRAADVIGMALSGGGIRSATFNLGLLEGLHRLNLLALFDYVATVSGGGYIGSFWSESFARQELAIASQTRGQPEATTPEVPPERLFPTHRDAGSGPQDGIDLPQERHLREFSDFLAPRWGFFEVETWTALVAVISGLLPAVTIALSIIGILLVGWLSLTFPLDFNRQLRRSRWCSSSRLPCSTASNGCGTPSSRRARGTPASPTFSPHPSRCSAKSRDICWSPWRRSSSSGCCGTCCRPSTCT